MDGYSNKYVRILPVLTLFSLLFLAAGYTSTAHAITVQQEPIATKQVNVAYFHVYRRSNWRYGPRRYYHRFYRPGVQCRRNCVVNRYGAVVRCYRRCY